MSEVAKKIKPLDDRVLLEPLSEMDTSVSGIIIPETANKERPQRGRVISVGPGRRLENGERTEMTVKVGDVVIFSKYAPDEIAVEGAEFIIAREDQILAVIE